MIVLQFGEDLLHNNTAQGRALGMYLELLAVGIDGCRLLLVEVNDLPVLAHERSFLLVQKVRRYFAI